MGWGPLCCQSHGRPPRCAAGPVKAGGSHRSHPSQPLPSVDRVILLFEGSCRFPQGKVWAPSSSRSPPRSSRDGNPSVHRKASHSHRPAPRLPAQTLSDDATLGRIRRLGLGRRANDGWSEVYTEQGYGEDRTA